jgi:WhiB family redox-sensing transcriptional regulator
MSSPHRHTYHSPVPHRDTRWQEHAACQEHDPILFSPPDTPNHRSGTLQGRANTIIAKSVCNGDPAHGIAGCPVRTECLEYALRHNVADGIWGGLTYPERKEHRRIRHRY